MTKQEQIEEMAKKMPEKIKDPLDNTRYIIFGKSLRREIARIYYNAGYRKLPEDSCVLSREEYKRITKELVTEQRATEIAKEYFEKMRKETAEKFLQLAYDRCLEKSFIKKVEELAKQFGVEIKE